MKVKELKSYLEKLPQDLEITIDVNDLENEQFLVGILENGIDYDDNYAIFYVNIDLSEYIK